MKHPLIFCILIGSIQAIHGMSEQEKAQRERKELHAGLDRLLDADPAKMWVYRKNAHPLEYTHKQNAQVQASLLSAVKAVGQVVGGNTVISLQELKRLPSCRPTFMQKLTDKTTLLVGASCLGIGYLLAQRCGSSS